MLARISLLCYCYSFIGHLAHAANGQAHTDLDAICHLILTLFDFGAVPRYFTGLQALQSLQSIWPKSPDKDGPVSHLLMAVLE